MKKTFIIIIAMLMPLLASAQNYPTGITPYSLQQAWEYFCKNDKSGGNILKKVGYRYVGEYNNTIGYNMVYTRSCSVSMGSDGFVKSARANGGSQYASYIEVGPGVGMDWSLSLHFLSSKGAASFTNLLKKVGYRLVVSDGHQIWKRSSTQEFLIQEGNNFSLSDVIGYDDF